MSNGSSLEVKREVPGNYGAPVLGPVVDRLDRFYGKDFFEKRIEEYKSTVFRVNMPPGPPFFPEGKVIAVLDQKSFPVLVDLTKVSKKNVFTGTYVPSTGFTGGYRVLSYLDPEEPKHAQLKSFCMDMMSSNASRWIPEIHAAAAAGFAEWDAANEKPKPGGLLGGLVSNILHQPVKLNPVLGKVGLRFLTKTVLDSDATQGDALTETGIKLWIAPQIAPVLNAGLPAVIQEALMHTAPIPFIAVEPQYLQIVHFFRMHGGRALDLAVQHGIDREEALHNLVFFICFNAFGGITILWPSIFKLVNDFEEFDLQAELREEVRAATGAAGGKITLAALENMPLLQSTVFEVMRYEPPVPSQYARAKVDFVLETHVEAFNIKAGEMLYGYQPLVTRDPVVFEEPDKFKPKRFMGEEGQKLLQYVFWSNGPETSSPTVDNKQCAGKNFLILFSRIILAEFFLHYDSFKLGDASISGTSSVFPFTDLKKRNN